MCGENTLERKLNIFGGGTLSLLIIIIIVSISYEDIGNINLTQQTGINENSEISSSKLSQVSQISQISHDPITIDGNDDFISQASSENWSGNGSVSNPFCIANYSISTTGGSGINISNTDVHFIIENVTVAGATDLNAGAFHFHTVKHVKLTNNTAIDSTYGFVLSFSSYYNVLTENTATNTEIGFWLESSCNNTLTHNTATENSYYGFMLFFSSDNVLTENIADTNSLYGFYLSSANNNTLIGNTATNNGVDGFSIKYSSNYNVFTENTVTNNNENGLYLYSSSNFNIINYNNITHNYFYGLYIEDASNNSICLNNFIYNNNGNTQAYSNSQNHWSNGTHGNFWSDYTGTDSNGDGIGDTTYSIDGDGILEYDPHPMVIIGYVLPESSFSDTTSTSTTTSTDNESSVLQISNSFTFVQLLIVTTFLAVFFKRRKNS